jgi:hypothetical protein
MTINRPAVEMVIQALSSTSDKIRALARAGYLRTEISKILDIRYQHVRKVLVDSGIADGLIRNVDLERPPVTAPAATDPPEPTPGDVLLAAGFRHIGEWQLAGDGEFELTAPAPAEPGVYAFIVDGCMRYVGLTQTGLRTRMGHYRRGHQRQRTSARVKALIATALAEGREVKVLVATPEPFAWNGLPVNTAAGLEAGLIRLIRPEWNMLGAASTRGR